MLQNLPNKGKQYSDVSTGTAFPAIITISPEPTDQSNKNIFIAYPDTNGLGAILCVSAPQCATPKQITLKCSVNLFSISAAAMNPRESLDLPSHYILYSATPSDSKTVTVTLRFCYTADCNTAGEFEEKDLETGEYLGQGTSITMTSCLDPEWANYENACPLLIWTSRVASSSSTNSINLQESFINLIRCHDPQCKNLVRIDKLISLGKYGNTPSSVFVGVNQLDQPMITYFAYKTNNGTEYSSLTVSRCSTLDCGQANATSPNVMTDIQITNNTATTFAMLTGAITSSFGRTQARRRLGSILRHEDLSRHTFSPPAISPPEPPDQPLSLGYGDTDQEEIIIAYTDDQNTKLYMASCRGDACTKRDMKFDMQEEAVFDASSLNGTIRNPSIAIDLYGNPFFSYFVTVSNSTGDFSQIGLTRCLIIPCVSPIPHRIDIGESNVAKARLASQFYFYVPSFLYTMSNGSFEYMRCTDFRCSNHISETSISEQTSDAFTSTLDLTSFVITAVVLGQFSLFLIWMSNRSSKNADFIVKYVTTPYLSTVRMTSSTRSWLRFLLVALFICGVVCSIPWVIFSISFTPSLVDAFVCPLIPPFLGLMSWLILRKATANVLVITLSLVLTFCLIASIVGVVWSIFRIFGLEKQQICAEINLSGLKVFNIIGGTGEILLSLISIFVINSIRLALIATRPEAQSGLLDDNFGDGPSRHWLHGKQALRTADRNWVKDAIPTGHTQGNYKPPQTATKNPLLQARGKTPTSSRKSSGSRKATK